MTRQKKIEILVEGKMWEWVYARNYDGLEEMLITGFSGYENFSNTELDEELDAIKDNIPEIKAMLREKKTDKKDEKEPFT